MKKLIPILTAGLFCLPVSALAENPTVYINENLGFDVEGYGYAQEEYPCDIDKVLVEKIVERGPNNGINFEAVSSAEKIHNGVIPVLAMDITGLVLGSEEHTYGTRSRSNLPSVRLNAALIQQDLPEGFVTARHSCAIAQLRELTPGSSSDVLDLGTYGHTICSATHRCLNDLSKDIVRWTRPQVQ